MSERREGGGVLAMAVGAGVVVVGLVVALPLVVAVIGILAAIAIPSFLTYTHKAKLSESDEVLAMIRLAEEAYRMEYDTYTACAHMPDPLVAPPGPSMRSVTPDACWEALGAIPEPMLYCTYAVDVWGQPEDPDHRFVAHAYCDVDGDLVWSEFELRAGETEVRQLNPGES